ncbi:MAG: hypothetical protein CR997_00755 [Acidobacteria bacterium]|nr:MAG: hypothetical protein CR997_00755 [Acidobacteriota bacterium]
MVRQRLEKNERKRQIKKATIELITKNGYSNTSVQQIVDKAEFSKGGFYNCYASKKELFKEILSDSMDYSHARIRDFKSKAEGMDRKTFLVEILLNKIFGYNDYKKLFVSLFIEMSTDQSFFDFYTESMSGLMSKILTICDEEGIGEYKPMVNDEFDEFNVLISTLILGVEIFKQDKNEKYRDMLREILTAYFEKIHFFSEEQGADFEGNEQAAED